MGSVHFEWYFQGRPRNGLGVELHFEKSTREVNLEMLAKLEKGIPQLEDRLGEKTVVQGEWGEEWARLYIQENEGQMTEQLKQGAVQKMAIMIDAMQPLLDGVQG